MNNEIIFALREIGVPANVKGYGYLKCALKLCFNDGSYIYAMTKRLYPEVAKEFNTLPSRAERAIRHAIEVAFDRIDPDTIQKYFGNSVSIKTGRPTNRQFIAALVEQLNREKEGTHDGRNN